MSMLPAYGKAKAAAYKIFAMMDYEPDIDAYSAKGAKVCELLLHLGKSLISDKKCIQTFLSICKSYLVGRGGKVLALLSRFLPNNITYYVISEIFCSGFESPDPLATLVFLSTQA